MRTNQLAVFFLLPLALIACSGIEVDSEDIAPFAAKHYQYYTWRTAPLVNSGNSTDMLYVVDPVLRREVDQALQKKGYRLDREKAEFSVDYLYASGVRNGEKSQDADNIIPRPVAVPNRQVDQAVVDNAYALGGVKETNNIVLQFNDIRSQQPIWRVVVTEIVEDLNHAHTATMRDGVRSAVQKAMKDLPPVQ